MGKTEIKSGARYQAFRAATPCILSCCWFFGSILIGLLVFFGVTSYNGELLDVSNCLDWIIDIKNLKEDQLAYYFSRLALANLYIFYTARIVKKIVQSINSFRWALKGNGDEQSRTYAVLNLNTCFGAVCGLAAMHVLWARLLGSTYSLSDARGVLIVGAVVFAVTGVIVNYAYERQNTVAYVAVDTLRNLLAVLIVIGLMHVLQTAALEELYRGVVSAIDTIEAYATNARAMDVKNLLLVLYNGLCYPILRMILWLGSIGVIRRMAGNHRYASSSDEKQAVSGKFYRTYIFSLVIMVITCVLKAMCEGIKLLSLLPTQIKMIAPVVMLCVAGILLFKFTYPTQYAEGKQNDEKLKEKEDASDVCVEEKVEEE